MNFGSRFLLGACLVERILRKHQAGFRSGRSCKNRTFVVRRLIKEAIKYLNALVVNLIDFEKTFNSVFRQAFERVLSPYIGKSLQLSAFRFYAILTIHTNAICVHFEFICISPLSITMLQ